MKLFLSALLAIQCCQLVQATDDHDLTSRVSKTLTKQFKTISSLMEKHPVNVKSIHALHKKKFQSLHRNLEQDSECLMDMYNIYEVSYFYELDAYENNFSILPDFSASTWIGDESALSELSDACADLGGLISFLDMNVEECEELPLVYSPFCIPNSCTMDEALELLNQGPPDDDYFGDGDDADRRLEHEGDDYYEDCSYEYMLSEGPPEITDSCFTKVINLFITSEDLWYTRSYYWFFAAFGEMDAADSWLTNFTESCEEFDASVYFTKGETNGQCFTEDEYGYPYEAEGWDALPECIPNECTQEEALEAYETVYSMEFESQPDCVIELEYTSPPNDETPEESPPSPPSPDGPSSKAPKSIKSAKSTKISKALKMVKMPKGMVKATKDEYTGLRNIGD